MHKTKFITGDATNPQTLGNKIIAHICNDIGGWGKGFVMAISKKWKEPEAACRAWHKSGEGFALGEVQFVQVEKELWIANLVAQHKIRKDEQGRPPIRYEAVKTGMLQILKKAQTINASVHMPRIGCGLAGGKWEHIQAILDETLIKAEIDTTVYDFAP